MILARELGQMPETIENMSEYWFARYTLLLEAEAIHQDRQSKKLERQRTRGR